MFAPCQRREHHLLSSSSIRGFLTSDLPAKVQSLRKPSYCRHTPANARVQGLRAICLRLSRLCSVPLRSGWTRRTPEENREKTKNKSRWDTAIHQFIPLCVICVLCGLSPSEHFRGEDFRIEPREVRFFFTRADKTHRDSKFLLQGDGHAAAAAAVELG